MQHVAALDHDAAFAEERSVALVDRAVALHVDVGLEPRVQPQLFEAMPDVPGDVVGRGRPRRDDVVGKSLGDRAPGERDDVRVKLELAGRARLHPADHEVLGADDASLQLRCEHVHQPIAQRGGEPVG